jgi:hypothetical protein
MEHIYTRQEMREQLAALVGAPASEDEIVEALAKLGVVPCEDGEDGDRRDWSRWIGEWLDEHTPCQEE